MKIHVRSFTSILRFEFRANYPNYFRYHLKYLSDRRPLQKLQNRCKIVASERCKIVQSSFDGAGHIVKKIIDIEKHVM